MATVQQTFAFLQAGDAVAQDPVALTRPTELTQPKQLVQPEQLVRPQPIGQLAELGGPRDGVAELRKTGDGGRMRSYRKRVTAAPSQLNLDSREMIVLRCCGSCVPKWVVSAQQAISHRRPCRPVARRSTPCCPRVD